MDSSKEPPDHRWSTPKYLSVDQVADQWVDGWVDDDEIVLNHEQRTARLDIKYIHYPEGFWKWMRVLPVMVDRVVFEQVASWEKCVDSGEGTLWLSAVDVEKGRMVVFNFTQGSLRLHASRASCLVSTRSSGVNVVLLSICGIELRLPEWRWGRRC